MRTNFSPESLADPILAEAERNLRACVHCGICTATCPTYVLLGDERDSPRGRIVMMQQMLEQGGPVSKETVHHLDRCLSCLGCRTACPSGVNYPRLIDAARAHIETHYRRPWRERLVRAIIARLLPSRGATKFAVAMARLFAPIATRLPGPLGRLSQTANTLGSVHRELAVAIVSTRRIALIAGCVQTALAPQIDDAVGRILARRGRSVVPLQDAGCCGALAHHLGRREDAKTFARRSIVAFEKAQSLAPIEAVLMSATGCAAQLREYPHLFADEPEWLRRASAFAEKVRDFSALAEPRAGAPPHRLRLAWQMPCSLQHALKELPEPGIAQLRAAGFDVVTIPEGHLCCGSAGSYSILQPEIAAALRARKLANIAALRVDAVASPNIGCLLHLSGTDAPPVVHPAELIDWAEGGPMPAAISRRSGFARA